MKEDLDREYQKTLQLLKDLDRNNNVYIIKGKHDQPSVQRIGLLARILKLFGIIAHRR